MLYLVFPARMRWWIAHPDWAIHIKEVTWKSRKKA